ncbi:MAG: HypC/HybG/HupF family hydrogenase formation chaperone [Candidatus Margulisbacteria bacterium]|nr:HypC/HybG/HupF family hydrogenase formation chaperone [Candidatus Margulisiibacteriota bacterium]
MCYAIPGKVTEINGKTVTVDYFGEKKTAINELSKIKIGDYVFAQGGFVISPVAEKEALETLEAWQELFFALKETDMRMSRLTRGAIGVDKKFSAILDKAAEGRELKREELLTLLKTEDPAEQELLYKTANFLRQKYLSNSCCVHGIIEFSSYCQNDCAYCGIRRSNTMLKRYRMSDDDILRAAGEAIEKYGFKALVLQAGEDPEYTIERLVALIKEIKRRHAVLIFISVGEVGKEGLAALYEAGARGLLMRFETSNPQLYENLHPGDKLQDRIDALKHAYEIGYLILTGGLIGLPAQTDEDLLNDILLTKELHAEMFSFGPVLPEGPKTSLVLKTLAVARIVDPVNAKILVTTGFETLDQEARRFGLLAGCNSVMLNVTPMKYRKLYSIYPDRAHVEEEIGAQIKETLDLLQSLGRAPTDLGI